MKFAIFALLVVGSVALQEVASQYKNNGNEHWTKCRRHSHYAKKDQITPQRASSASGQLGSQGGYTVGNVQDSAWWGSSHRGVCKGSSRLCSSRGAWAVQLGNYHGRNQWLIFDFSTPKSIDKVMIDHWGARSSWLHAPKTVSVQVSNYQGGWNTCHTFNTQTTCAPVYYKMPSACPARRYARLYLHNKHRNDSPYVVLDEVIFYGNAATRFPTAYPTNFPTAFPTAYPTAYPTAFPTAFPTSYPTAYPTPGCSTACYYNGHHITVKHDRKIIASNWQKHGAHYYQHKCYHDGTTCHCECSGTEWKGHGKTTAKWQCKDQQVARFTDFKQGAMSGCEDKNGKLSESGGGCKWTSKITQFDNKPFEALDVVFDYADSISHADTDDHITIEMRACKPNGKDCTSFVKMAKKTGDTGRGGSLHYTQANSYKNNHGMTTSGVFHAGHGAVQVKVTMDNEGTERYFSHWQRYLAGWHRVTYVRRHCYRCGCGCSGRCCRTCCYHTYTHRYYAIYRHRAVYKRYSEKYNLKDIRVMGECSKTNRGHSTHTQTGHRD